MPKPSSQSGEGSNKTLKVLAAFALLFGAGYIAVGGYQKVQPTAAINNGNTGAEGPGGRMPDMRQVAKEAGVTPAQQAEIEKAREAEGWRGMMEASQRVLTEEQRDKIRQTMQARMAERDKKNQAMLSEADYKAIQERRRAWGGRGGGRGQGGGPGQGGGRGQGGPGGGPGGPPR